MKYPTSANPDEWADAFEQWIQQDDSVFDHDTMASWFEAAFGVSGASKPTATPDTLVCDAASGVWVSFYEDRSGTYVFGQEIDALRHAVDHSAQAKFLSYGKELLE